MQFPVVSPSGKSGTQEVSVALFGQTPNARLLAQAVQVYLFNQRQGSSKVKTRAEVARTKQKWFKQKGTGRARHGARTPNIFVGGGVSHGPTNMRDWTRTLSKTLRRKALVYALSARASESMICDDVNEFVGKTKQVQMLLDTVAQGKSHVLVVMESPNEQVVRAMANLDNVLLTQANRVNPYELLLADAVIYTNDAIKTLEKRALLGEDVKEAKEKPVKAKSAEKPTVKKTAKPAAKKTTKKSTVKAE